MLAWDGLVLLAALVDGLRLPAARQLTAQRTWSNAPALDSETEIELTIENQGRLILDCRMIDDLPRSLGQREPPTHRLMAFPRVPASLRYRVEPQERGDCQTGWLYLRYRSGLGLAERWAKAPLAQTVRVYPALRTGEEQQIFLARSRQIDLQLRQARQRGSRPRLREPARISRRRRPARHLLDRHRSARQPDHAPIPDRAQPGRMDRARLRPPDALARRGHHAGHKAAVLLEPAGWSCDAHSKLDHACTTAVALAQLALFSGDRVGLLAYGQTIQQRLLPGRGAAHLRQIDRVPRAGPR